MKSLKDLISVMIVTAAIWLVWNGLNFATNIFAFPYLLALYKLGN
jgi:hypothetical protein